MAAEVTPKNILMIGPTGVGKTEIARRLAHLAGSPFLKVEASKFTEVGYVGRDVESMVRDLVSVAIEMVRREKQEEVRDKAAPQRRGAAARPPAAPRPADGGSRGRRRATAEGNVRLHPREAARPAALGRPRPPAGRGGGARPPVAVLPDHVLAGRRGDGRQPEGHAARPLRRAHAAPPPPRPGGARGAAEGRRGAPRRRGGGLARWPSSACRTPASSSSTRWTRSPAARAATGPTSRARACSATSCPSSRAPPSPPSTAPCKTDHVLFIAAGAFHVSKPSDLIPELQGRFPIRVELEPLTFEDLVRILREPKGALLSQYKALLGTEGVDLQFTEDAIAEMARFAMQVNDQTENIGARRLATILETVLEEVSFEGGHGRPARRAHRRGRGPPPAGRSRQGPGPLAASSFEDLHGDLPLRGHRGPPGRGPRPARLRQAWRPAPAPAALPTAGHRPGALAARRRGRPAGRRSPPDRRRRAARRVRGRDLPRGRRRRHRKAREARPRPGGARRDLHPGLAPAHRRHQRAGGRARRQPRPARTAGGGDAARAGTAPTAHRPHPHARRERRRPHLDGWCRPACTGAARTAATERRSTRSRRPLPSAMRP